MDPLTHTLTGAALSRSGLRRHTALATATLVIAANAPDIDIVTVELGEYASLALRRGITHGPIALLVLPFVVAGAVLAYDRLWRRRRNPQAEPARPLPLLLLAFLGVLTHPMLDWLNTYGIRLLMPFSPQWFYGDALFIIDPWLWLLLGGALAIAARGPESVLWIALAGLTSTAVLLAPQVPPGARAAWLVALVAIAGLAWLWRRRSGTDGIRMVRAGLVGGATYILLMIGSGRLARAETLRAAHGAGIDARAVMLAPEPANPFAASIVVQGPDAYHRGSFDWRHRPRVRWDQAAIPLGPRDGAAAIAMLTPDAQHFLTWSRFPFTDVSIDSAGATVRIADARYPKFRGGLGGVTVRVPAER
jgi:inner membrane protein